MNWLKYGNSILKTLGLRGWKFKAIKDMAAADYPGALGFACPQTKTIGIASALLAKGCAANIKDTILHEIAHAICDTINGCDKPAHGKAWKDIAKALGAMPLAYGFDCNCCHGLTG